MVCGALSFVETVYAARGRAGMRFSWTRSEEKEHYQLEISGLGEQDMKGCDTDRPLPWPRHAHHGSALLDPRTPACTLNA